MGGRGSHSKLESSSFTDFAEGDTDEKQFFGIGNGGDNDKWLKSLSEEKRKAITEYTMEDYGEINNYLRGNASSIGEEQTKQIEDIREGITGSPLKSGIVVHRYDYGGFAEVENIYELENMEAGKTVLTAKGFLSTSLVRKTGFGDIGYDIKLPKNFKKGQLIKQLSMYPSESEFLINHGTKFKVTGVSTDERGTPVVQLEYLE